ncbi:low choriolytic enzyme-like [Tautogolabrus adspersus]
MTPVFIVLLFLSLSAVHARAIDDEVLKEAPSDVSQTIEGVNSGINTRLAHGDILLNIRRNADPCVTSGCKWPKSGDYVYVPVTISSIYSAREKNLIIRALLAFHESTCIRFMWRRRHQDYLSFESRDG